VLALINGQSLDAPILIRTAYIDQGGRLRVPVGATLVRHSTPEGEVAETYTKAAGVLAALRGPLSSLEAVPSFAGDPEVQAVLARRNETLARFWLDARTPSSATGLTALVVDAEDTFTGMLAHQLRALGLSVTICSYDSVPVNLDGYDLVVPGPGPGDPRDLSDPKMAAMRTLIDTLLATGKPMLAVCLGHQILAGALGLTLRRREETYQGMQREISVFGRRAVVGFYSTFTADVDALRGPTYAGLQFHPESVLSRDGFDLLRDLVNELLGGGVGRAGGLERDPALSEGS
jgi:phenazine biosynthesis protein phzE